MQQLFDLIPVQHHEAAKNHIRAAINNLLDQVVQVQPDIGVDFDSATVKIGHLPVATRREILCMLEAVKRERRGCKGSRFICTSIRTMFHGHPSVQHAHDVINKSLCNLLPDFMRRNQAIRMVVAVYGLGAVIMLNHPEVVKLLKEKIVEARLKNVGLTKLLGGTCIRFSHAHMLMTHINGPINPRFKTYPGWTSDIIYITTDRDHMTVDATVCASKHAEQVENTCRDRFLDAIIKSAKVQL